MKCFGRMMKYSLMPFGRAWNCIISCTLLYNYINVIFQEENQIKGYADKAEMSPSGKKVNSISRTEGSQTPRDISFESKNDCFGVYSVRIILIT